MRQPRTDNFKTIQLYKEFGDSTDLVEIEINLSRFWQPSFAGSHLVSDIRK